MKHVIPPILFMLATILVFVAVMCILFSPSETELDSVYKRTRAWAKELEEKNAAFKVVYVSGSSGLLGIDAAYMRDIKKIPFLNAALIADASAGVMLDCAWDMVKQGDTLVLSLEPLSLDEGIGEYDGLSSVGLGLWWRQKGLCVPMPISDPRIKERVSLTQILVKGQISQLCRRLWDAVFICRENALMAGSSGQERESVQKSILLTVHPSGWYEGKGSLFHGDKSPLDIQLLSLDKDAQEKLRKQWNFEQEEGRSLISPRVKESLQRIRQLCDRRGVLLVYSMGWFYCPPERLSVARSRQQRLVEELLAIMPVYQDETWGLRTKKTDFHDHPSHLRNDVAYLRMNQLAEQIQSGLVWTASDRGCLDKLNSLTVLEDKKLLPLCPGDEGKVSSAFLQENAEYAYKAYAKFPWAARVSPEMFEEYVLPYAVVDETRESWRPDFYRRFTPYVENANSACDAALAISSAIQGELKVEYNIKREKPNQSPSESLRLGMASCTGLSILLVDALRSVGIPARLAGLVSWSHVRGNHNWVEFWDGQDWQMIEYNQNKINTSWVLENCAFLETDKDIHKIWVATWKKSQGEDSSLSSFPLVWNYVIQGTGGYWDTSAGKTPYAQDVSPRYKKISREYQSFLPNFEEQLLFINVVKNNEEKQMLERIACPVSLINKETHAVIFEGESKSASSDVREYLKLLVPRSGQYQLVVKLPTGDKVYPVIVTSAQIQLITFTIDS